MNAPEMYMMKPKTALAIRFTYNNHKAVEEFVGPFGKYKHVDISGPSFALLTHNGMQHVHPGAWIIKRGEGDFIIMYGNEFDDTYRRAG